ncbi:sensor histidine kinase [Streptomyces pseudovenezuelae]|uniref:histidine kinase n=1 Tax=Streptomyces pseudovenezuelae TaxID=67350 RepID=A0ABT6LSK6_9ACTN|nr:signal transduction histidine kinase [Streptomyces pseudovenezuelae]
MPVMSAIGDNGPVMDRLRQGARALTRPSGPAPSPTRRNKAFDAALALGLGVAAAQYVLDNLHGWDSRQDRPAPIGYPTRAVDWIALLGLALLASAPLALRRRYPLAVLWFVMGATLLTPGDAARLTFYACVIAAYSAAAYSPYRVATLATLPVAVLLVATVGDPGAPTVPTQYVPLLIAVPLVVAANGLRAWKLRADESSARLSAVEREQAEALRRAVEHERARIARELHDVVTHNVSVMVIQAGAARKVMEAAPDQAREALLAVEAGGRSAMSELRHVMGLLTMNADGSESADPEELEPQPGLDQLDTLVVRMRSAGVSVELDVSGTPRRVSAGVELAAYRVVQEALTNTVKHAAGATARVKVEYGGDDLRVEVTDSGGSSSPSAATGNGHGLIGLRERLAVYGGTLRTGPRPLGGYRVHALIPLEEA